MKVVILAGGLGTRLSEETISKPKPMVEVGPFPILWHIMKIYSSYGINDFIISCGFKGYLIKEYFSNYLLHMSDVTIDYKNDSITTHNHQAEPWTVTLVDTGLDSMTGGRLLNVKSYLDEDEPFCMTYGDGVADINILNLINYHKNHNKLATVTGVKPPGRYGVLNIDDQDNVISFNEKPKGDHNVINGGFFVFNYKVLDYIKDSSTIFEKDPLVNLSSDKQLKVFSHSGFWHPMDTLRDKNYLNELWHSNKAPWKVWD